MNQKSNIRKNSQKIPISANQTNLKIKPAILGAIDGRVDARLPETCKIVSPLLGMTTQEQEQYTAGYENTTKEYFSFAQCEANFSNQPPRYFQVDKDQFGETYHIAAAMLYDPGLKACLKDASLQQQLFLYSIFNKERFLLNTKTTYLATASDSTVYITKALPPLSKQQPNHLFDEFVTKFLKADSLYEHLEKFFVAQLEAQGLDNKQNGKAIIWLRNKKGDSTSRNMTTKILTTLTAEIQNNNINDIILVGDPLPEMLKKNQSAKPGLRFYNFTEFQKSIWFTKLFGNYDIGGQLLFFRCLQTTFNTKFAVGMMSGAMDGPAFCGLPTISLTKKAPRLEELGQRINTFIPVKITNGTFNIKQELAGIINIEHTANNKLYSFFSSSAQPKEQQNHNSCKLNKSETDDESKTNSLS